MTDASIPRDPTKFTTLDDFLKEEGILDEATAHAKEVVAYERLFNMFIAARSESAPHGWEMTKLIDLRIAVSEQVRNHQVSTSMSRLDEIKTKVFIYQVLNRGFDRNGGFNISTLNDIHRDASRYLEDLAKAD